LLLTPVRSTCMIFACMYIHCVPKKRGDKLK